MEGDGQTANLVVQVTNVALVSTRIVLQVDRRIALDAEIPAMRPSCYVNAIYEHPLKLPAGRALLTLARDDDAPQRLQATVSRRRQWLVVYAQGGVPLHLEMLNHEPL